jgi:phage tail sheath protein FI
MPTYLTPGVYVEEVPSANKPIEGVGTSIAAFVGLAPAGPIHSPVRVSRWGQFAKVYGDPNEPDNGPFMEGAFLAHAVRGFFDNGGSRCWVVRVGDSTARELGGDVDERSGLVSLAAIDEVTVVCMPDAMTLVGDGDEAELTALQGKLIAHSESAGNRMAILDCPPGLSPREVLDWRTRGPGFDSKNEGVVGVEGLGVDAAETDHAELEAAGVNSIRAFPGQGIRVWGARTLSSDPEWRYLSVRRVFLHLASSIDQGTRWTVF